VRKAFLISSSVALGVTPSTLIIIFEFNGHGGRPWKRQVVHHHFGRANTFAPPVATLNHFEDGVVGLGRIMALRKRFMPVRVERLADDLLTLDAVLAEQLLQLFQRHLHPLMKLRGVPRCAGGQSPFEIVNDRQQFNDERFLLRHRAGLAFLPAAPLEILKVGGQAQMQIFLFGEILEERFRSMTTRDATSPCSSRSRPG
jgi:hypothetical protein